MVRKCLERENRWKEACNWVKKYYTRSAACKKETDEVKAARLQPVPRSFAEASNWCGSLKSFVSWQMDVPDSQIEGVEAGMNKALKEYVAAMVKDCLLYTSPSPRD